MNKKLTPHIIAVNALVVFIVLGLACATSQRTSEPQIGPPSQNFTPPIPLTQTLMRLDDPRMPPDRFFIDDNGLVQRRFGWLGTLVPANFTGKLGFFYTGNAYNIFIDGIRVGGYGYIGLVPGKHTVRFSYNGSFTTDFKDEYGKLQEQRFSFSNLTMEIDVESDKTYSIHHEVNSSGIEMLQRAVHGYGKYNISFLVDSSDLPVYNPPSLLVGGNSKWSYIYLEPYDPKVPLELQSLLSINDGIYVVGFNGNTVSWGAGKGYCVTIGIPAGRHELHLADLEKNILYTITINFIPRHRYHIVIGDYGSLMGKIYSRGLISDETTNIAVENGKFTRPK